MAFSCLTSSFMTPLRRSSNWPRNFVPATSDPRSSEKTVNLRRMAGTRPSLIASASPSARAVLPVPGSPTRIGLFFWRRQRICWTRRISGFLPISGSTSPRAALALRLVQNCSGRRREISPVGIIVCLRGLMVRRRSVRDKLHQLESGQSCLGQIVEGMGVLFVHDGDEHVTGIHTLLPG